MKTTLASICVVVLLISCTESSKKSTAKTDSTTVKKDELAPTKKKKSTPYKIINSKLTGQQVVANLKKGIAAKGLTIFNQIDHVGGAKKSGQELPFTYVIVFGNPEVGTKLMQCDQSIGIELPLKILVSTNKKGRTQLTYLHPKHYNEYFKLGKCKEILKNMETLLNDISIQASGKESLKTATR